jgi:hypothetical protein
MAPKPKPLYERMMSKIDVDSLSGCWRWLGGHAVGRGNSHYGKVGGEDGRTLRAHRAMYEILVGPIPEGLTLDHLCKNTLCVNPQHLEIVSGSENSRRTRTTCCKNGHPWTEENTIYETKNSRYPGQGRRCRACAKARSLVRFGAS